MPKEELKNKISMALKGPILQIGFEIICKNLSELEKENIELKDKLNNLASVAEVRLANWQKYEKENAELKAQNKWYSEQVCNKECAEVWGKLTKAKELLRIGMEGIKREFLFDGNGNRPFAQEAIKLCNQFCEQAEQFLKEE